jgi:hypothetical protein
MTNIVERLRHVNLVAITFKDIADAADEIESLRQQLAKCQALLKGINWVQRSSDYSVTVAFTSVNAACEFEKYMAKEL